MNLINRSEISGLGDLHPSDEERRDLRLAMRYRLGTVSTKNATGKAMFERMMYLLPEDTQKSLKLGHLQLVDQIYYCTKNMEGLTERKLTDSYDNESPGLTNLDRMKIPTNRWVLLYGIQMLANNEGVDKIRTGKYGIIPNNVLNGEFELQVGNRFMVPNVSCSVFDTRNREDLMTGYWAAFDPLFIVPGTEIKPNLKVAYSNTPTTNLNIRLLFHTVSIENMS
jgi:hypothetical protein